MEHVIKHIEAYLAQTPCSLNQLARSAGIPQPVLHRIVHGQTTNPRMQTLMQLANAMHVPISVFFNTESSVTLGIPLYEAPGLAQQRHTTTLSWHDHNTEGLFALKAWDDSMAPIFPQHCQLIFHRGRVPQHHDYVLVKGPAYWLFRQLIRDGKQQYLYALSPSIGCTDFNVDEKIIAVLIESRIQWSENDPPQKQKKQPAMRLVTTNHRKRNGAIKLFPSQTLSP